MPTAEQFEPVPADARISVTMTGIPSGTVKPGAPATEVDVTLCNDSPVDYHKVGVVVVLTRCSCAITPIGLPEGTGERFDPHRHQAISTADSEREPNTVVQVLQKGYLLHDRVIRPALVIVARPKAVET